MCSGPLKDRRNATELTPITTFFFKNTKARHKQAGMDGLPADPKDRGVSVRHFCHFAFDKYCFPLLAYALLLVKL